MSLTTTHRSIEAATPERLERDPDKRPPDRTPHWQITTTSGYTVNGYLPQWAEDDPSAEGVELERLGVHLADIAHRAVFPGRALPVTGTDGPPEDTEVLAGVIDCHPYGEDPGPRLPVVHLHLVDDFWVLGLDPDALSHVAEQLHGQAAWLEAELRPRLIAARDDWDRHGQR
jgi:hypothetical protein